MAIYKLNDIDKTKKSALAEFNVIHPARPQTKTLDHLITERTRFNLYPWWLKNPQLVIGHCCNNCVNFCAEHLILKGMQAYNLNNF